MRQQMRISDRYHIVRADHLIDDMGKMTEAVKQAVDESPYAQLNFPTDSLEELIKTFMLGPFDEKLLLLAYEDEKIVGMLAGAIAPHIIAQHKTQAIEMLWWVHARHRQSKIGLKLLQAFEEWGDIHNVNFFVMAHYSKTPELSTIYKRKGYTPIEVSYMKEVR